MKSLFETITIKDVINHNQEYKNEKYHLSEDSSYILENMLKFISLRDELNYKYTDNYNDGKNWVKLDIATRHTKYGTNYIYIDHENKLYRVKQTASEFYGV